MANSKNHKHSKKNKIDANDDLLSTGSDMSEPKKKIVGLNSKDKIFGTDNAEKIFGLCGADQLHGAGGNDWIYGGKGKDILWGDGGNDRLYGGKGFDVAVFSGVCAEYEIVKVKGGWLVKHINGNGFDEVDFVGKDIEAIRFDDEQHGPDEDCDDHDDVPVARPDTDSVAAGKFTAETGNVITAVGTTNAGADTLGAGGAAVAGVAAGNTNANLDSAGTVGSVIDGSHGKLTLQANGSYSYVRDAGSPGGVSDVFTYTLKDSDGDLSHTTLTIAIGDSTPSRSIPTAGGATTTVNEAGLPARGLEPAGSNQAANSEKTSGTISFTSLDGLSSVSLGGHPLTTSPQTFTDATGSLTASYAFNPATGAGTINYSYTLLDNTSGNSTSANFAVVVKDADGDSSPAGNLVISIKDDIATAADDTDSIPAAQFGPVVGNVLSGVGSDLNPAGADTLGADGGVVVGVAITDTNANLDLPATLGVALQGAHGKLTLNADGSYSYVRDANSPGGVSDVFTYTIKDGDGDLANATLTIAIGNTPPTITNLTPSANGGDVTVDEDDLLASRGAGESAGSDTTKESITQTGTFNISAPDGIASLTIGGVLINLGALPQVIPTPFGNTLTITSFAAGVVSYSYTLIDNEAHASGLVENSLFENFAVVLTDNDGQAANSTLSVQIVDDIATAVDDTDSIPAAQFGPVAGNVLSGVGSDLNPAGADTLGADGGVVVGVAITDTNANLDLPATLGVALQGAHGKLTLNADGSYSYVRDANSPGGVSDVFTYTIKDGDGDLANATLTIAIGNTPPTITNLTPSANGGDVTVDEDDLLASRGAGESAGSDTTKESITQTGTFNISAPDGIASLTIGGVLINLGALPQVIPTPFGNTLTITSFAAGVVSYSYTLIDNEAHASGLVENSLFENFAVVLTDNDGQAANSTLSVQIVDDIATAVDDTDSIPAAQFGPVAGNVLSGVGSDGNPAGADTLGADGGVVVGVAITDTNANLDLPATLGVALQGAHGKLTLNADGSYSYVRDANSPGGVSDVFTYTIKDGDGDLANATLTIAIGNTPPTITNLTPSANGGDVTVDEDDLLASRGAGESAGSDTTKESITQTGTFNISAPDGIASLTIGGVLINLGALPQVIPTPFGNTLTITSFVAGVVSYSYTLIDNEAHASGLVENSLFENFAVVLTDNDGQAANSTLSVQIVDDIATAVDDTDSIPAAQFGPVAGNVLSGVGSDLNPAGADTLGADGGVVVGVAITDTNANLDLPATLGVALQGAHGKLTLNADGSYSYVRDANSPGGVSDVFTYTIKDGDGDLANATLTIAIGNTPPTITNLTPSANGGDVTVDEDDLLASRGAGESAGSDTTKESITQTGTFNISAPDGIASLTIGGVLINLGALPQVIPTPFGNTLTITSFVAGVVSYSYTLIDNEAHASGLVENSLFENFAVVLTDNDGQAANSTLSVQIVDDIATAVDDTDSIPAAQFGPVAGNVLSGVGSDGNPAGADTLGADGGVVVGVAITDTNANLDLPATLGVALQGAHGKLTLNADGSYSYVRDANSPGGVSDVFTYTIKDGDGDLANATLTIAIGNTPPTITNLTPSANGGDVTVDEDDLLASRGAGESAGSDTTKESITQTGTFNISAPDGIASLTIGGVLINLGALPQVIPTPFGNTLTITSFVAGVVSYSYTLIDNEAHASGLVENSLFENFAVVLTDNDGQAANSTLSVQIVDDIATAVDDTDSIPAAQFGPVVGNVLSGVGSDLNPAGADTLGADGGVVVGVAITDTNANLDLPATLGVALQGAHGKLTLNADGSYSYVRDANSPGGVSDVFTYTIKDGDGDLANATLTIAIGNTPPTITNLTPSANGGDVTVDEDDLLASRGAGESAGSDTTKESITQTGTFNISAPDGIASLTIGGVLINLGALPQVIPTPFGNTLTITSFVAGVVSYSYTLIDNEAHASGLVENSLFENFAVVLTDNDGQAANSTLSVQIVDDIATAVDDTDSIPAAQFGPVVGNVLSGVGSDLNPAGADTLGADGGVVVGVAITDTNANLDLPATLGVALQGAHGKLTLNADGSYSYVRDANSPGGVSDVFTYTIKDGDGDLANATLTIAIGNTPPTITNLTPSANGGDVTVDEDDLLASRGAGESAGSDTTKESITQTGTFNISAPDGIASLTIGGVLINLGALPQVIPTPFGNTLTITSFVAGVVSYSYTLIDNEAHASGLVENSLFENFAVVLTDNDGQAANSTLSVQIVDDIATAVDDTDSIPAAQFGPVAGNVLSGVGSDLNPAGADTLGADGGVVVGVAITDTNANLDLPATLGVALQGAHGKLTLNADGSYSYVRDANSPGGVSDVFTYTIKDGDGDLANATLTIAIGNTPPTITNLTPSANGGDVTVDEDDLLASRGAGESAGSDTTKESITQTGTFNISAPDGIASLTIGGVLINLGALPQVIPTPFGNTLTITSFVAGVVSYSYTLIDNEAHASGLVENSLFENFAVVLTDNDGQAANSTLSVQIVDDIATAVDDTDSIPAAQFGPVVGNVLSGVGSDLNPAGADTLGADGGVVVGVAITDTNANLDLPATLGVALQGAHGKLTLNADGSYSYVRDANSPGGVSDVFTYTIKDGDGDLANATLTIAIGNTPPTITNLTPSANGGDVTVDEDDLLASRGAGESAGSDTTKESITQTGTFNISAPDGIASLTIGGVLINLGALPQVINTPFGNTLTITSFAAGVVSYSYTLIDNEAHASGLGENSLFENFPVVLTDNDGQAANSTLSVQIVDDIIATATSNTTQASPNQGGAKSDMLLIVDFSGSMFAPVGGVPENFAFGNERMDLARLALLDLINQSSVDEVKIVRFGSEADSTVWMSKATAIAYVLNDANFATDLGATDYDAALRVAKLAFDTAPTTADQRLVQFLSDGEPNENDGTGSNGISEADTNNAGFGGLGEETHWINFLAANNVSKSGAFGIGGLIAANANNLEQIAWQSPETAGTFTTAVQDSNVTIISNADLSSLGSILVSASAGTASGNVLTDGTPDAFGADGGRILSIQIGGTTYTWDGIGTITLSPPGPSIISSSLTNIPTPQGGTLTFNFVTGAWSYATPSNVTNATPDDVFNYVIVDNDGDPSPATLTIDLVPVSDAPQIHTSPGGLIPFWTTDPDNAAQTFINRVGFFDNDIPATVRVTFTSPNASDVLTAVNGGGVTIGGSGTSTVTLDGTIADINAFLASNRLSWNPAGANQADRTLSVSIDDNGTAVGGTVLTKSIILDHRTFTFDGGDNVDFAGWNLNQGDTTDLINSGAGNDTVVTSWSHGPDTQDVEYNGGDDTDTVTLVFTPDQLEAVLTSNFATLNTYLDGDTGGTLNLGGTTWNATVTGFENAVLALRAGSTGHVVYSAIGGTDANLPEFLAGLTGDGNNNTLVGTASGETISGNAANDVLVGAAGSDTLQGGSGGDLLLGGAGDDTVVGGTGNDILSGGAGEDIFTYAETGAAEADNIVDYSFMEGDKINLSALLDANFIGSSVVSDFVRLQQSGSNITVQVDVNGLTGGANWVDVTTLSRYAAATQLPVKFFFENAGHVITQSSVVATGLVDPIILDLQPDGVSFTSMEAGVQFDINADGAFDQMAWTVSGDGILALDLDGSGAIEDGSEILSEFFAGGGYSDGLAALASLDDNGDGVIDSADTAFASLLVWQDLDHDGASTASELKSLAEHNIASISLTATPGAGEIDGQSVVADGTFTYGDGSTGNYVEVDFDAELGSPALGPLVGEDGVADAFHFDIVDNFRQVDNFNGIEGDTLDLAAILDAAFGAGGDPGAFVQVEADGNDIQVFVDLDGSGGGLPAHIASLLGANTAGDDPVKVAFGGETFMLHA